MLSFFLSFFFFFNDTATTEIYTLSLHDALPISPAGGREDRAPDHERGADQARPDTEAGAEAPDQERGADQARPDTEAGAEAGSARDDILRGLPDLPEGDPVVDHDVRAEEAGVDEDNPLGRPGRPMNRRSPFRIGFSAALGVGTAYLL